jgi:hypothetical protein
MPSARTLKRSYSAAQLGLQAGNATTGVWATQLSSNIYSLHKAAAATTSVVNLGIPGGPRGGIPTNEDAQVSIIEVFYKVSTANLTSAPTAILNLLTMPGGTGTGIVARSAVTQVLTFAGVDTVGTTSTNGDHIAVVTITTPFTMLDSDHLNLSLTMNEAATSVLDIFGITVTYV